MAKIKQRLMSMAIVAAMIISCMPMIGAQAAESAIIFQADFNGADDTANWARFNSGDAWQESGAVAGEVDAENGYLVTKNMTTGYGSWGVYFGVLDDAYQIDSSKENIYVETRFKAS